MTSMKKIYRELGISNANNQSIGIETDDDVISLVMSQMSNRRSMVASDAKELHRLLKTIVDNNELSENNLNVITNWFICNSEVSLGKQLEYALDIIQASGELRQHEAKKKHSNIGCSFTGNAFSLYCWRADINTHYPAFLSLGYPPL